MSAIIEYRGEPNIAGLTTELHEKGYQIELLTKGFAAVSSIEAIKSMKPMILQDVLDELERLKNGFVRFVYSRPEQAEPALNYKLEHPRMMGPRVTVADILR